MSRSGYQPPPENDVESGHKKQGDKKASDKKGGGIPMEDEHTTKEFVPSKGLTSQEASARLIQYGRNELEDKKVPKVLVFDFSIFLLCSLPLSFSYVVVDFLAAIVGSHAYHDLDRCYH